MKLGGQCCRHKRMTALEHRNGACKRTERSLGKTDLRTSMSEVLALYRASAIIEVLVVDIPGLCTARTFTTKVQWLTYTADTASDNLTDHETRMPVGNSLYLCQRPVKRSHGCFGRAPSVEGAIP